MSNEKKFVGTCVSCTDEDDVLTIGVGDDDSDPENFFIIGRFDEDDLSVDECIGFQSDATEYEIAGAVASVTLDKNVITVSLHQHAADKTGISQYSADISSTENLTELKEYLRDIFDGSKANLVIR
ncbi:hypothetical protein ACQPT2_18665 [Erwinia amylovora]